MMNGDNDVTLQELVVKQTEFQNLITKSDNSNTDTPIMFSYHIQAMVEELGELLKADKRWKTHRNDHFDPANKKEEMCDVFITILHLIIFSGYDISEFAAACEDKINENYLRLRGTI